MRVKIATIVLLFFCVSLFSPAVILADYCSGGGTTGTVECPNPDGLNGCNNWYCVNIVQSVNCGSYLDQGSCESFSSSGGQQTQGNPVNCVGCGWVVNSSGGGGASCSDGIQNQGETGVDCGGPCSACGGGGGGGGGGGCTAGSCNCGWGGAGSCVPNSGCPDGGACCTSDNPPGCSGGGGAPACDANNWGGCSASCGNGSQTNDCGDSRSCCSECGPNWGACSATTFTRTGTYNCGSSPTTQACTGTITGTFFDATNIANCAQMGAATKIPGGVMSALTTQNTPTTTYTSAGSNNSGIYSVSVRVPDTYSLTPDMSGVAASFGKYLSTPRLVCQAATAQLTTQSQSLTRDFGFWKVYDSWFQVIGGNIRAEGISSPTIQSYVPPTCTGAAGCSPYLLRRNTAGTANTSGYAVTGANGSTLGTVVSAYSGGDLSKLSEDGNNLYAATKRGGFKEGYEYFANRLYSMGVNPTSDFSEGELQDLQQFDPANRAPVNTDRAAYYANGDVTISSAWAVPSGKSIVILVNGNLTINANITVANGGFLAFITAGNITIGNTVGTAIYTSETPQVEGVYIADGTFTTESKSSGGVDVSDLKFVGAGTFVGWSGVVLDRDYKDTADPSLGVTNNTSSAELFIGRPDLAFNAPAEMKKPQYTWQEVAP